MALRRARARSSARGASRADASGLRASHPLWIAVDVAAVAVFVAIGRSVHDHGVSARGMASTSWPFLVGVAAGWWLIFHRRANGSTRGGGLVVLASTVVIGMSLRVLSGQGTAAAFVAVTTVFLGLLMLGPREAKVRRRSLRVRRPAPED